MSMKKNYAAIVVMSGGQDSTTCLALATLHFGAPNVAAVSFKYGQRHEREISAAQKICAKAEVDHLVIEVPMFDRITSSALVDHSADINVSHRDREDVPASFVYGRNAIFLTQAFALALEYGAENVITGVCQTDSSGYSDCREDFVRALETALNTGYEADIKLVAPLMHLNKAETFALAEAAGALPDVINLTVTCYNGSEEPHAWGAGCGECPACKLREKGYVQFIDRDYAITKVDDVFAQWIV
jgi:7-cyano-7-deazaguanine synthase